MRLGPLVFVLVVVSVALPARASAGLIDLRIRFQADVGTKAQLLTLRCADRATGTVPHPADACKRLHRLADDAFRRTPPNTACTAIFGGPSTARVTGTYLGRPIWVRLRRDNGCEIARWQRVGFLLPQSAAPR
jgi:Subtilisin inhibitor-like